MSKPKTITLCVGSSCFSRGNADNHQRIAEFLAEHHLDSQITFKGCRCGGFCSDGPNVWVDDVRYSLNEPGALEKLLQSFLEESDK